MFSVGSVQLQLIGNLELNILFTYSPCACVATFINMVNFNPRIDK